MPKLLPIILAVSIAALSLASANAVPIPAHFDSAGVDRKAIEAVLDTYTRAVSTKDEALFETLLLNKDIPFSGVGSNGVSSNVPGATEQYTAFRKGVFDGTPFTQRFQDIHIDQDGPLASVSLVFVNTAPDGSSWGWKTMQLLKIAGRWKIASEFYTGHPDERPAKVVAAFVPHNEVIHEKLAVRRRPRSHHQSCFGEGTAATLGHICTVRHALPGCALRGDDELRRQGYWRSAFRPMPFGHPRPTRRSLSCEHDLPREWRWITDQADDRDRDTPHPVTHIVRLCECRFARGRFCLSPLSIRYVDPIEVLSAHHALLPSLFTLRGLQGRENGHAPPHEAMQNVRQSVGHPPRKNISTRKLSRL